MSHPYPILPILLTVVLVGEVGLMRTRLSSDVSRKADRGSLGILFIIIFSSVGLAWLAGRSFPHARFDALFELGPTALKGLYGTGLGLFAAGLGLRWYSVIYLGRLFTYDVAIAADHQVIDSGPYRLIRHPAYAGSLLTFVGIGICGGNALSMLVLVLPIALAFLHRIFIEEAALRSALGERYCDYAGRTKRLIPLLF
jgi:protein-S-isoprenylcysteine O-methyltransferase